MPEIKNLRETKRAKPEFQKYQEMANSLGRQAYFTHLENQLYLKRLREVWSQPEEHANAD